MNMSALFPLGRRVATPGALKLLEENKVNPSDSLALHPSQDWRILSQEDYAENKLSLKEGFRFLSAYKVGKE
jgi:hypothetical protein